MNFCEKAEIIVNRGYPAERHWVTTEDGYILEMQRIPYGKKSGPSPNKPAVFLLHGLMSWSMDWIVVPNALGTVLIFLLILIMGIFFP